MRSLFRTALCASLTIETLIGTGCLTYAADKNASRLVRRDQRMLAAQLEETRGHLEEAKRLYTAIHQSDPSNAECCHRLGLLYAKLNRYSEAEVFFRKADAISPGNPRLLADRGYSAFQRKDYLQAEEWLERSVQLESSVNGGVSNRSTLRNLAIVRAWLNKDELSLETFRRIHGDEEALRNLAAIQIARGDRDLGMANNELAKIRRQKSSSIAETTLPPAPPSSSPVSGSPASVSTISDHLPELLAHPTPAVVELSNRPAIELKMNSMEIARKADERNRIVSLSIPSAPLSEAKVELVSTCARPIAALTRYPLSVTSFVVESSYSSEEMLTDPGSSASTNAELEPPEDLVFELPIPRKLQGEGSEDPLPSSLTVSDPEPSPVQSVPIESSRPAGKADAQVFPSTEASISSPTGPSFEEICLVTLCEERRIVKGSPDFSLEYFGQRYHCSTAETLQKFRTEPQRYIPAAGGLDVVIFRNQREFTQGILSYSSWYRHRLYLFGCQENREEFKQNPQKYIAAE